jgi:hypothetical protein
VLFHQLPAVHGDAVRSQWLVYAQPVLPRAAIPLVLLVCWKGDEGMHKIAARFDAIAGVRPHHASLQLQTETADDLDRIQRRAPTA